MLGEVGDHLADKFRYLNDWLSHQIYWYHHLVLHGVEEELEHHHLNVLEVQPRGSNLVLKEVQADTSAP